MPDIRIKAVLYICALSISCLFLWLLTSAVIALAAFSLGLLFYLYSHLSWLHQLHVWFKTPLLKTIPEGSYAWEDVFTSLLQYERSNIANQNQLNAALERFNLTANAIPDGLVILSPATKLNGAPRMPRASLGLT